MNMSYCRFRNTAQAYRECLAVIKESEDLPEELADISIDEKYAMIALISMSEQLLDIVRERLNLSEHAIIDTPSIMQWVDSFKVKEL